MSDGPRHVLRPADLSPAELEGVLELAAQAKADPRTLAAERSDQTLVAIIELPSTRTRLAFAAAAQRLGMTVTAVAAAETQLARGEALVDTARTLSALSAAIVVRTGSHELLEELASTATVPTMSSPAPVLLPTRPAPRSGFLDDPREAVSGADVVYTDVWTSMDGESAVDTQALAAFRVDGQLMALAAGHAVFLHCLPARRGVEVTADVLDGPSSLVWQHVANQIPVTQALVHSVLSVGET